MKTYNNLLLIAGTGRNSGKTRFAAEVIRHFSGTLEIYAIKISPHFHKKTKELQLIKSDIKYHIYQETTKSSLKDTGRMYAAGATKVYYIESNDSELHEAFLEVMNIIPDDSPVVCESPALRRFFQPGLFVIADSPDVKNKKTEVIDWKDKADLFIQLNDGYIESTIRKIEFKDASWILSLNKLHRNDK